MPRIFPTAALQEFRTLHAVDIEVLLCATHGSLDKGPGLVERERQSSKFGADSPRPNPLGLWCHLECDIFRNLLGSAQDKGRALFRRHCFDCYLLCTGPDCLCLGGAQDMTCISFST